MKTLRLPWKKTKYAQIGAINTSNDYAASYPANHHELKNTSRPEDDHRSQKDLNQSIGIQNDLQVMTAQKSRLSEITRELIDIEIENNRKLYALEKMLKSELMEMKKRISNIENNIERNKNAAISNVPETIRDTSDGHKRTISLHTKNQSTSHVIPVISEDKHEGKKILNDIPNDYLTLTLVLRWIEFLLERVPRDKISLVLDYYKDIGWISEKVKSMIMAYARGEIQDITGYDEDEMDVPTELPARNYRHADDWRLSAEDHLKSLLFIQMIAGIPVDKDKLNSLEQFIKNVKKGLDRYHGV